MVTLFLSGAIGGIIALIAKQTIIAHNEDVDNPTHLRPEDRYRRNYPY